MPAVVQIAMVLIIVLLTALPLLETAGRGHNVILVEAMFAQPCRLTIALIQIGAKGEVQPFETG